MEQKFIAEIENIVGKDNVKINEPMGKHCTFRCGGNASLYVIPGNIEELVELIKLIRNNNEEFVVIGNGSNILVKDSGYRGIIIEVNKNISDIDIVGEEIVADAGAKLSSIAVMAMESDLAGFEFAHGIPGNVGGAVAMNAGAYGGEMKNVIKWVKVLDNDNNIKQINVDDLELGYRTSLVSKQKLIVLQMCIKLEISSAGEIGMFMDMLMQKRRSRQPLEYPSAGSTFKRPEGYFAGKLIEDAGLRGYSVGGAMVSEKHCGFVINYSNATATDVINVIEGVKKKVQEDSGVILEPEVKILGE